MNLLDQLSQTYPTHTFTSELQLERYTFKPINVIIIDGVKSDIKYISDNINVNQTIVEANQTIVEANQTMLEADQTMLEADQTIEEIDQNRHISNIDFDQDTILAKVDQHINNL